MRMRAPRLIVTVGILCLAGCPNQPASDPDTSASNDNKDDAFIGDDFAALRDQLASCGVRAVSSVPSNTYVEVSSTNSNFSIDPPNSSLAKVLYPQALCGKHNAAAPAAATQLYEVGPDGAIVSICTLSEFLGNKVALCSSVIGWRFIVDDGCLRLDTPNPLGFDLNDLVQDQIPDSPCGPVELPLSRSGRLGIVEPDEPFVCIRFEIESYCRNCGFQEAVWSETTETRFSAVTRGSLAGVSTHTYAELCNVPESTVDIRDGERVTITHSLRSSYCGSPSPEELGYQRSALGAFPQPTIPPIP